MSLNERERVDDVVKNITRNRAVERGKWLDDRIEKRGLLEPRGGFVVRGSTPRPSDHFLGEIDSENAVTRLQKGLAHKAGAAARVEQARPLRKGRESNEPRQCQRIGLNGSFLELRGLAVECLGEVLVVVGHKAEMAFTLAKFVGWVSEARPTVI